MIKYTEVTSELGNKTIVAEWDGFISYIPVDPANSDYQRYLRWLENPNEVEHLTEIPTPPAE